MKNICTQKQISIMNQSRLLWEQHVYWTRFFIVSTVNGLNDIEAVTSRLLQNPADFEKFLNPFFTAKQSQRFKKLFTDH